MIADADTGFGNAINVVRTVQELESAGAAGIHLEDQVTPKRCGHFEGKQIVSKAEMVNKVRAAVEARRDEDFVIIARTDARAVVGLEEAVNRALAYREAGADMIFVEAPRSTEELDAVAREVPGPLVANMVEGGKTPPQPAEVLEKMGYRMVIYANLAMRAAMFSMQQVLSHLAEHGDSLGVTDRIISMEERNRITNLARYRKTEERYSPRYSLEEQIDRGGTSRRKTASSERKGTNGKIRRRTQGEHFVGEEGGASEPRRHHHRVVRLLYLRDHGGACL